MSGGNGIAALRRPVAIAILLAAAVLVHWLTMPTAADAARVIPPATGCTNHGVDGPLATSGIAPDQLAAAYDVDPLWRAGFSGQGRRVALLEVNDSLTERDYGFFSDCFGPWPNVEQEVAAGSAPTGTEFEPTLDADTVASLAPRTRIYMFESGPPYVTDYEALPRLMAAALNPANTGGKLVDAISISDNECELSWPPEELDQMQTELAQAWRMRVAVVAAQGDSGSSGSYVPPGGPLTCAAYPVDASPWTAAGTGGLLDAPGLQAGVWYPASSPLVTGVGGTQLVINGRTGLSEAQLGGTITDEPVWNQPVHKPDSYLAGGGGTSTLFTTTDAPWQQLVGLHGPERKPDISALAGSPGYLNNRIGTSGAAPLMAGAIAVLDSYLVAHHMNTTGPLNPILYRIAAQRPLYRQVFNDVIDGTNDLLDLGCCTATTGYDDASGLGSLNVSALAHTLLAQDRFTVANIATALDGSVRFRLKLPGAGSIAVLETAWKDNLAHSAALLEPARHRFVFARKALTVTRGRTVTVTVQPDARGRQLVADPRYRVVLRLWVSYTPVIGTTQRNLGFYGLHLGCRRNCYRATEQHPMVGTRSARRATP